MASIWKELLFLHGHFVRAEDLVETAAPPARPEAAAARPDGAPRDAAPCAPELAGGCA